MWVRACGRAVEVFHDDRRVAAHENRGRRRTTLDEHLPAERGLLRHRGRAFWESRAHKIGPETLALVRAVFDQDGVLSHLRTVQAIVKYLEPFPTVRAEAACQRAREVGVLTYRAVKQVLTEGLDFVDSAPVVQDRATASQEPAPCPSCLALALEAASQPALLQAAGS